MAKRDEMKDEPQCASRCKPIQVPTEDELEALHAMRAIKGRAREMKKRLSEMRPSSRPEDKEEARTLKKELGKLKTEWDQWEEKRKEAARERMILLGHEEAK